MQDIELICQQLLTGNQLGYANYNKRTYTIYYIDEEFVCSVRQADPSKGCSVELIGKISTHPFE
jgi:hypothetical protein